MIKKIIKVGNSAGVILPKSWYGGEAKVELIKKPLNIQEEIFKILEPNLTDIIGIYLTGSYARNEQTKDSDVDIIAITENEEKEIIKGKFHISIYPLEKIKNTLNNNPILILPRLIEARPILNQPLLEELKSIKIKKENFIEFIKEIKSIITINEELLNLYKESIPPSITYSLVLRSRAIYLIKNIINKKIASNKLFKEYISKNINKKEIEDVYEVYKSIRDNKKPKKQINKNIAKILLNFLKKEIINLEKELKNAK